MGENEWVVAKMDEIMRVPEERRKHISKLLQHNYGDEIWAELVGSDPDLATRLSLARLQAERRKALDEFSRNMIATHPESWWQDFFERNQWIFGYGLKYCVLRQIAAQPHYGGVEVSGHGGLRGDFLFRSEADVKFTVLAEIKTPKTALLSGTQYRNGAWAVSNELNGGLAQLQACCRSWLRHSTDSENEWLTAERTYTVTPKGLLIIGCTSQLGGDREKKIEGWYRAF